MKLGGIDFGPVLGASGVQNFFGEGYPYHRYYKLAFPFGFRFQGLTFAAKTTTLPKTPGNMPMRKDGVTPKEFKPKCIVVNFRDAVVLNAVGLSGPGAADLFERGLWQQRIQPFMLSFMPIHQTPEARIEEAYNFFQLFKEYLPGFRAPVALQFNLSCPNRRGLDPQELTAESNSSLAEARTLGIPIVVKVNAYTPIETVAKLQNCDGLCVSNALPWHDIPNDWKIKYFGSTVSPLDQFGGGGLSGAPLLPVVADWVFRARQSGIALPINAGGGILRPRDIVTLKNAGADSVFLGTVAMVRPWRLQELIETAHRIF